MNGETFKNGIQIRAKFVVKCMGCGEEFFEEVEGWVIFNENRKD